MQNAGHLPHNWWLRLLIVQVSCSSFLFGSLFGEMISVVLVFNGSYTGCSDIDIPYIITYIDI